MDRRKEAETVEVPVVKEAETMSSPQRMLSTMVTSARATFECQVQDVRLKTREGGGGRELRAPTVSFY